MDENTPLPIMLSVKQVNVMLAALAERPYKDVADLFANIKGQADEGVRMALLKAKTTEQAAE